ncbi:hypothetical protein H8E77_18315 [bacterium]|nr:hypothetical protein [bacterium]
MEKEIEPIPEDFVSIEEAQEFWETHDTTDYNFEKVEGFNIDIETMTLEIQLKAKIAYKLLKIADEKKISIDELINAILKSGLESYEILAGNI